MKSQLPDYSFQLPRKCPHTLPPLLSETAFRQRIWQITEVPSSPTIVRMDDKLFALQIRQGSFIKYQNLYAMPKVTILDGTWRKWNGWDCLHLGKIWHVISIPQEVGQNLGAVEIICVYDKSGCVPFDTLPNSVTYILGGLKLLIDCLLQAARGCHILQRVLIVWKYLEGSTVGHHLTW